MCWFWPHCQLQSSKTPVIHNYLLRSSHSHKVALLTSLGELYRVHTHDFSPDFHSQTGFANRWQIEANQCSCDSDNHAVWMIKTRSERIADAHKIFGMLNIWSCRRFIVQCEHTSNWMLPQIVVQCENNGDPMTLKIM